MLQLVRVFCEVGIIQEEHEEEEEDDLPELDVIPVTVKKKELEKKDSEKVEDHAYNNLLNLFTSFSPSSPTKEARCVSEKLDTNSYSEEGGGSSEEDEAIVMAKRKRRVLEEKIKVKQAELNKMRAASSDFFIDFKGASTKSCGIAIKWWESR